MRMLMVGNFYPPHHFGGYEQVWQSAVRFLRGRGHEVRVLATDFRHGHVSDGAEPDVYRLLHWYWRDHDFARVALPDRLRIERHNHRLLKRHLAELEPDVVSFWAMGGMPHSLIEAVHRRGIPIVAFVHDEWLDYGRFTDQWMRIFYDRRWIPSALVERITDIPTQVDYRRAARYVFVSDFIRRRALELPLELEDTAVAHSGIARGFLSPGTPHEWRWRLLYVGRLHPDKGIHDAVSALALLPEEATLTFAGTWDPRDEAALEQFTEQRGVAGRVTLLGQLAPDAVAALYRDHDALVFPVRWQEPWGLVPLEAMGCGCPVVATGQGGSAEFLTDGENCLLVPPETPAALAAALHRLAASADLRAQLRAGGIRLASLHTEDVFNSAVERHLEEAAGMSSTRPEPALA